MTTRLLYIPTLIIFVFFSSCSRENGVSQKIIGDYIFKVRRADSMHNGQQGGFVQLILEVGISNHKQDLVKLLSARSGFTEEQVLYYLSYTFQNDIFLIRDGKKLNPDLYHFERSFDLKPFRTINIGFLNEGLNEVDLHIESEIFDIGIVKIKI